MRRVKCFNWAIGGVMLILLPRRTSERILGDTLGHFRSSLGSKFGGAISLQVFMCLIVDKQVDFSHFWNDRFCEVRIGCVSTNHSVLTLLSFVVLVYVLFGRINLGWLSCCLVENRIFGLVHNMANFLLFSKFASPCLAKLAISSKLVNLRWQSAQGGAPSISCAIDMQSSVHFLLNLSRVNWRDVSWSKSSNLRYMLLLFLLAILVFVKDYRVAVEIIFQAWLRWAAALQVSTSMTLYNDSLVTAVKFRVVDNLLILELFYLLVIHLVRFDASYTFLILADRFHHCLSSDLFGFFFKHFLLV